MDKQAFDIEPNIVRRFALGGLVTGAGSAAMMNLLHMLKELNNKRLQHRELTDTDENTIVLTLPHKAAMIEGPGSDYQPKRLDATQAPNIQTSRQLNRSGNIPSIRKGQARRFNGQAGIKTAATGWPTLTAAALATLGGGTAGYMLVDKLYAIQQQRKLEAELRATQQEYLDALIHPSKSAMWQSILPVDDVVVEKTAQDKLFGFLNFPIATAALLSILGTGGTAYITKRILDEKLRESENEGLELPKLRRIVFRSAVPTPTGKDEKTAEEKCDQDDIESIKAALAVMLDVVDVRPKILTRPEIKEAMVKCGQTPGTMMAQSKYAPQLIDYLRNNPELRKLLIHAAMEEHPILQYLKWGYNIPGISHLMDNRLYGKVNTMLSKPVPSPTEPFMSRAKTSVGNWVNNIKNRQPRPLPTAESRNPMFDSSQAVPSVKSAQILSSTLSSFIGNTMAGSDTQALVDSLVAAQKKMKDEEAANAKLSPKEVKHVDLVAQDPAAKTYLAANKAKLLAVLHRMATEGKL